MGKDVIIACDFASKEQTLDFLKNFTLEKPYVKIGIDVYKRQVWQADQTGK